MLWTQSIVTRCERTLPAKFTWIFFLSEKDWHNVLNLLKFHSFQTTKNNQKNQSSLRRDRICTWNERIQENILYSEWNQSKIIWKTSWTLYGISSLCLFAYKLQNTCVSLLENAATTTKKKNTHELFTEVYVCVSFHFIFGFLFHFIANCCIRE